MKPLKILCWSLLSIGFIALSSCDKVEKASQKDVTISNISIELTTPISELKSTLKIFSGDTTFNINNAEFGDLKKYASYIKSIKDMEVVVISSTSGNGTVINDFNISYPTQSSNFTISAYNFGEEFTNSELKTFVLGVFNDLVSNKEITLKVTGKTDETSAQNITHKIFIKKATILVQLVEL